jgi:hypothetical protein
MSAITHRRRRDASTRAHLRKSLPVTPRAPSHRVASVLARRPAQPDADWELGRMLVDGIGPSSTALRRARAPHRYPRMSARRRPPGGEAR